MSSSEEAAELLHEMKTYHVPMKSWYNDPKNAGHVIGLQSKYGEFPMFWRDLMGWEGWREVKKEYLRFVEGTGDGGATKDDAAESTVKTSNDDDNDEERRRKRRSRWANDNGEPNNTVNGDGDAPPERKRKSRWDRTAPSPAAAAVPADPVLAALGLTTPNVTNVPPSKLSELQALQSRLRLANSRLTNLESESARIDALPRTHPERSPSPPPLYNADGSRKNTRAVRWREKYTEERAECLERILEIMNGVPAPSFLTKRKRSVKIPIPVEEHPTYNFIGLIIGPRGKTQKEMENSTGCKIAIRGRGSVKEGARGRLMKQPPQEGDDEPLHVLITGEDPSGVERAAEMVRSMLVVIDDEKNVHKQNQLRELALLNGTLKESEEWCITCGEKGHKNYECPKRFSLGGVGAGAVSVKCAICGETSHPTRDCKSGLLGGGGVSGEEAAEKKERLDEDYSAFMAELDGTTRGEKKDVAADSLPAGGAAALATAVNSMSAGDSVLTIIQPARVVRKEERDESGVESLITTISSTVPNSDELFTGVTTISSTVPTLPAPGTEGLSGAAAISSTGLGAEGLNGVTTISSTFSGGTLASSNAGVAMTSSFPNALLTPATAGLPPPPPPPGVPQLSSLTAAPPIMASSLSLPPPPVGLPPPPAVSVPPSASGTYLPVPPPPPPSVPAAYSYLQQQGYSYPYAQPGYPQQPPYGQAQQQQWGGGNVNATAAWDPNAYYDPTGGAGGFNWWDSSESG